MSIILSNLFIMSTIGLAGGARHLPPIDANKEAEAKVYELELDGVVVGWVANLQGGEVGGDVVEEKLGTDVVAHKHVGNVKYEDISFRTGLELSTKFYDWIKAALAGDVTQHSGAIIGADANLKTIERLEFTRAVISEVCIPAANADSKDSGWFTFRISPESTKPVTVKNGATLAAPTPRKSWISSNFRLTLDGLDCSKVTHVAGLNIKLKVVEAGTGHLRDPEGVVVNPKLDVTLPEASVPQFDTWIKTFVPNGNNASHEKNGHIDFLTADLKSVLCSLNFANVGVGKITAIKGVDGKVKDSKVEMYYEHAKLMN